MWENFKTHYSSLLINQKMLKWIICIIYLFFSKKRKFYAEKTKPIHTKLHKHLQISLFSVKRYFIIHHNDDNFQLFNTGISLSIKGSKTDIDGVPEFASNPS